MTENRSSQLEELLRKRIVIIDGAMGTMLQLQTLDEATYRGERFKNWHKDLKGLHDLLNINAPQVVETIHRQYLEAGADIIATNTFNPQRISLADYGLEELAYEIAKTGAQAARRAADAVMREQPSRTCFVAGAIGPTTPTSSIFPDVKNSPAPRLTYYEPVFPYT